LEALARERVEEDAQEARRRWWHRLRLSKA
jgi:hypothetical protein